MLRRQRLSGIRLPVGVGIAVSIAMVMASACGSDTTDPAESSTKPVTTVATATTAAPTTSTAATTTTTTTTVPPVDGGALDEPGQYGVGRTEVETIDTSRDDRHIRVVVFYPAMSNADRPEPGGLPDTSAAPYPVVVGDGNVGDIFGPHLASHGFVFAAVQDQSSWGSKFNSDMLDFPIDHMRALDALETLGEGPAAGIADTARSGAIGYSFGGWDALMLTGVRIDPAHYARTCSSRPQNWSEHWWAYICGSERRWGWLTQRAEKLGITNGDGLWEPLGDERIKAAMPMAAEGYDMTGPAGLASGTAAVLLIGASADDGNDYDPATTDLYENYPGADLITFVGAGHLMIYESDAVAQMNRFAVAFFGLHLQGDPRYAALLTEEYVERIAPQLGDAETFETLVWGVYGEE